MKFATFLVGLVGAASPRRTFVFVDDGRSHKASEVIDYYLDLMNAGATEILNAFMVPNCPCGSADLSDTVADWASLPSSERAKVLAPLRQNGGHMHLVTGGAHYRQQYLSYTPKEFTDYVCGHAYDHFYDGVTFDLEHIPEGFGSSSPEMIWAIEATRACRNYVQIVNHAPPSKYLGRWGMFGYDVILPYVDNLLVQYYNHGADAHHDKYENLFLRDVNQASINEIGNRNPKYREKIVLGKAIYSKHASSGVLDPQTLAAHLERAETELKYTNGLMIWKSPEFSDTPNLRAFIDTDLPLLSRLDGGSTAAPTLPATTAAPTLPATTAAPTLPATTAAPTLPATTAAPTLPATTAAPTLPATTAAPTRPATTAAPTLPASTSRPTSTPVIDECGSKVGNPYNPAWDADCKELCFTYAVELPAHCPGGSRDAEVLAQCVLEFHPDQCVAV